MTLCKLIGIHLQAFTSGKVMPNQSSPELVGPPLSLSAYLRFGCLSIRKLYWALHDEYVKVRRVNAGIFKFVLMPLRACRQSAFSEPLFSIISIKHVNHLYKQLITRANERQCVLSIIIDSMACVLS